MRKQLTTTREFYDFWYSLLRSGATSKSFIGLWKNGEEIAEKAKESFSNRKVRVSGWINSDRREKSAHIKGLIDMRDYGLLS